MKIILPLTNAEVERFWKSVDKTEGYGPFETCWLWTGAVTGQMAYGAMSLSRNDDYRQFGAHRVSYALNYGVEPGEMCVLHKCDVPRCVNPAHLFLGTLADNVYDRVQKRHTPEGADHWMRRDRAHFDELLAKGVFKGALNLPPNGEDHPCTVLTAEMVREIKILSAAGVDNKSLAAQFGVTHSNISAIVLGKSWSHIEGPTKAKDERFASKMTVDKVREIRRRYKDGESKASLARAFKIGETSVFKITHYLSWKHVTDEP